MSWDKCEIPSSNATLIRFTGSVNPVSRDICPDIKQIIKQTLTIDKEIYTRLNHVETLFKLNENMHFNIVTNNPDNKQIELFLSNYAFVFT